MDLFVIIGVNFRLLESPTVAGFFGVCRSSVFPSFAKDLEFPKLPISLEVLQTFWMSLLQVFLISQVAYIP